MDNDGVMMHLIKYSQKEALVFQILPSVWLFLNIARHLNQNPTFTEPGYEITTSDRNTKIERKRSHPAESQN